MPRSRLARRQSLPYDRSESKRSPRINHDHNRDRSGVDDGTGATGASDIRQRVDSNGIGRHHSNMASLVGNPDLRKFETHHLLSIVWALEQPIREPSIPIENIFSYDPFRGLDVNESVFMLFLGLDQVAP